MKCCGSGKSPSWLAQQGCIYLACGASAAVVLAGPDSEPGAVQVVYDSHVFSTFYYLAAAVTFGVGAACWIKAKDARDLRRVIAKLSFPVGVTFILIGAFFWEELELTPGGLRFRGSNVDGEIVISCEEVHEVKVSSCSRQKFRHLKYHSRWDFMLNDDASRRLGDSRYSRHLWYVTRAEEETIMQYLRDRGVSVDDNRRRLK